MDGIDAARRPEHVVREFPEDLVAHLEGTRMPSRLYRLPKIIDMAAGTVTYETTIARKQPDWTYSDDRRPDEGSMPMAELPHLDEHGISIAVGGEDVWLSLLETLDEASSRAHMARYARMVGLVDSAASGPRSPCTRLHHPRLFGWPLRTPDGSSCSGGAIASRPTR